MYSPALLTTHGHHLKPLLAAAAVPAVGWTIHSVIWRRRLAAARRDPLTGALDRDGFTLRAQQLLDRYAPHALLLMIDVDYFKEINDVHGHAAGDAVLAATADRLAQWAGSHGTVGRLGGDEFVALTRSAPGPRRTTRLDRLTALLTEPVTVNGVRLDVAVSIGAAAADTVGTSDLPTLQRAADAAMYEGKHTGRALLARPDHAHVVTVNGRRAGRPGTHHTPIAA